MKDFFSIPGSFLCETAIASNVVKSFLEVKKKVGCYEVVAYTYSIWLGDVEEARGLPRLCRVLYEIVDVFVFGTNKTSSIYCATNKPTDINIILL